MKNKKIPDVRPAPKSASTVPLSFKEKFFFGIGPIGKNLSAGIVASNFLTLYFMGTLGLSPAFFAVLFFVGRIWDGVNDLMMGTVIDHTKSKLGKFRPWIIIGTLTNALVAVMIYSPPNTSQFWLYFFVTVMYILHDASYTMVDVGYWALIPALSLEAKEREQLSLIPRLVGAIGGLIGGYSLTFVNKLGGNERGFFWVSLIFAGVYMLTMLSTGAMVKERVLHVQPVQEKFSLIRGAKILFANDQALTIVVIMTFFNVACTLTVSVVMFYFTHVLENDDGFGHYNIIIGAARGLGLLGFAPLSRMFGRDRISKIAYLAPCLGYALFMIFSYTGVEGAMPIYIAGAVTFVAYGCMDVMQGILLADAVDYGEWKTGQRNEGIIFSMLTFLSKLANGISSLITYAGFAFVGFQAQTNIAPTENAVTMIKAIMYIVPPIFLVGAFLVHKAKFKLNPELMEQITAELKARRQRSTAEFSRELVN